MLDDVQKQKVSKKLDGILQDLTKTKKGKEPKIPGATIGLTSDKETFYFNYKGVMDRDTGKPINKDTIFSFFSCTKAMTAFAVLQLYERGQLKLDDLVSKYLPQIEDIYIVEKGTVDKNTGEFLKPPKKPKNKIKISNLLTMTAGMSYPILNEEYVFLAKHRDPHINSMSPTLELFKTEKTPLVHEPGVEFLYGHSMDWAGLIVQKVTGKPLGDYLKENLFDPIGMSSCTFHIKDTSNMMRVYGRGKKGKLIDLPQILTLNPEVDMGGQGCFGTIEDYLKFIRMWLNYGYSPDGKVRLLNEDLVRYAIKNHLPPGVTIKFDFPNIPEFPDGFSLAGMAVGKGTAPTGRGDGTVFWSGLANLFYWVDHENKLGGFFASQMLPFGDPHSMLGYAQTEMAVYDTINGEEEEEEDDDDDEDDDEEEDESGSRDSKL